MNKKDSISKDDVTEIIEMANTIYNNGNMFGVFTPQLLNENLNDLNNHSAVPNKQSLDSALKGYKYSADVLRAYSEFAQVFDPIYNRAVNYYADLLAFDMRIDCRNAYRDSDYNSKEYADDYMRVAKFFDNFDYKGEFRKVLNNILRNEVYFTWLRDSCGTFDKTGEIDISTDDSRKLSKYTLQTMPQARCLITGEWEHGLLYDFDMYYFTKAGVDLNAYDPIFRRYYREMFDGENIKPHYNPTAELDKRTGQFVLWTQTSPEDGAWCFKFNMANMNNTPFLSGLIKQVLSDEEMSKLQYDKYFLEARAILAGDIGMMSKQQSGQKEDATALNAKTLTKFLTLVKMGLVKNINAVAMPTEGTKLYQYENKNPDMYSNQLEITGSSGASAGSLLYTSGKSSQFELQSQIVTDYNVVAQVYSQFENFLDFYVNKKTRKFKFNFHLSGSTHPFMREQEKKNILDCANVGIVPNMSVYSKIFDMSPFEFERSMRESKATNWSETMTSELKSLHNQSSASGSMKPIKDDTEISENGAIARDYNEE